MTIVTKSSTTLALHGGEPVRSTPLPVRQAVGANEIQLLHEMLAYYQARDEDPPYQGEFEARYTRAFVEYMGGGYADAVATGTISLFVALAALNLPKNSEVLVSPITDPGTLSAIILCGLTPKIIDSQPHSFNVGPEQVKARISKQTSCALIVHAAGQATPIQEIVEVCKAGQISVLEDCSQAHGAEYRGKKVGTFGDIAAFSTMYRKASITGSTGGVVYTKNEELYFQTLAHADRGKPRWLKGFDDRDPNQFLFPALNLHANEFGCAIGLASFARLDETKKRRLNFINKISAALIAESKVCLPYDYSEADSPFYYPIFVDSARIRCSKREFAEAVRAEGIGLNPHYQYLVADWPWIQKYLADNFSSPNARMARDNCFCLYVNENYGEQEVKDVLTAILKVEHYYLK